MKLSRAPKKQVRLSVLEQIAWADRLSMLLRAGVSLSEGLTLMADSSPHARVRIANRSMLEYIMRGNSLSEAMTAGGRSFHKLLVRSTHIGETSGTLAEMLRHVAESFRSQEKVKQQIISAGVYPACIGLATVGVAGFLIIFIFPKVMPLFLSMHIELPFATRMLLHISGAITGYWWEGLLGIILAIITLVWIYRRYISMRNAIEQVILRLPLAGSLSKQYACTQIFQIVAILIEHGASMPQSISEASEMTSFYSYSGACASIAVSLDKGQTCAKSMREFPVLFSSDIIGLMSIAERSGETASACEYIAEISRAHVETMLGLVSRLIEPILMLFMGLVVGSIALSIIMPIYEITNHLTH